MTFQILRCWYSWKQFLELLLWKSFQLCRHIFQMSSISWNLRLFMANFIFRNNQKSFGAKSRERDGFSISVMDFWARNYLTDCALSAGALSRWKMLYSAEVQAIFYAKLDITASKFPHDKIDWLYKRTRFLNF